MFKYKIFPVFTLFLVVILFSYSFSLPLPGKNMIREKQLSKNDVLRDWQFLSKEEKIILYKALAISYIKCYFNIDNVYLSKHLFGNTPQGIKNLETFINTLSDYFVINNIDIYSSPYVFYKLVISLPFDYKQNKCIPIEELQKEIKDTLAKLIDDPEKKALLESENPTIATECNFPYYIDKDILLIKTKLEKETEQTLNIKGVLQLR